MLDAFICAREHGCMCKKSINAGTIGTYRCECVFMYIYVGACFNQCNRGSLSIELSSLLDI